MEIELAGEFRDTEVGREARELLRPCVQCGQCTFTCPTFRMLEDEWDGPRGRIYLIRMLFEGREPDASTLPPAYTLRTLKEDNLPANLMLHLDRCLTCRSCENSCPQGVRYGRLLDIARELVEKRAPRPLKKRLMRRALRAVVPYPRRFRALLRTGQALRRFLPADLRRRIPRARTAGPWPGHAHARTMLVWQGCVQPSLAPDINAAAARVLDRFGIRLVPAGGGCCGAFSHHLAAADEARAHMRRNVDALWPHVEAGAEAIVTTASACGAHLRDYGSLLSDDPQYAERAKRISEMTRDISEIVAEAWSETPQIPRHNRRIAFQSPCSLQHAQQIQGVVEGLLRRAGFTLMPVAYRFMCCGAAGSYSILQPALSKSLRTHKLETLLQTRPERIASANIGCLTHLADASPVPVMHWIEVLDETFRQHDSGGLHTADREAPR